MKILHLHIGTHKTATTSLQVFCQENESVLEKNGYCYPLMPFGYPGISEARNGHFLIGKILDEKGEVSQKNEEKMFREGMKQVNKIFQKYDHVVLSDEGIWLSMDYNRTSLWETLQEESEKRGFKIHVIVYLKRQDKYLQSVWNQRIKAKRRIQETFEEFVKTIQVPLWLNYYQKLKRMAEIIGKENITVRRFEPNRFIGGSIYADFLEGIGLSLTDEYQISAGVRNEGLYGNTLEIKRVLNGVSLIKDNDVQEFMKQSLEVCSKISAMNYPSTLLSGDETKEFLDHYRMENRKVAQEFLHEQGTELFDETIEDLPQWEKDNPCMTDDVIRFFGTVGMDLFLRQKEMEQRIKTLEQKLKVQERKTSNIIQNLHYLKHPFQAIRRFINNRKTGKNRKL